MPMSHVTTNVRAAALRAEFQNESGEVALSSFIRETTRGANTYIGGSAATSPTRNASSTSTAKMNTGKLPYETAGVVFNSLITSYSSSSAPTKTVPKQSLSNVSYSDLRGTANVPHAGTSNFNTNSSIIGDDSNTSNSKYHQGVGAFKPGQAIQTYQSGMGSSDANSNLPKYAMVHGQKSNNANNYIDLVTHAAPGDIMWSMAVTSTGSQPTGNGTMYPAWSTSNQNTAATALLNYGLELFDGNDRWTVVHAKVCKGGERYCYHRLNYGSAGQNYAHMCGLIRSPSSSTAVDGRAAFAATFSSNDYENKTFAMGTLYGSGEIMIFADLTPYASSIFNNTSGTDNSTSRYHGSTGGGSTKYAVALGQYQEAATSDVKGGWTVSTTRSLTIRGSGGHTGSGENSMILLRLLV
jgi:hypothetical protein